MIGSTSSTKYLPLSFTIKRKFQRKLPPSFPARKVSQFTPAIVSRETDTIAILYELETLASLFTGSVIEFLNTHCGRRSHWSRVGGERFHKSLVRKPPEALASNGMSREHGCDFLWFVSFGEERNERISFCGKRKKPGVFRIVSDFLPWYTGSIWHEQRK